MVSISKSGFHWSAFGNQQGSTFTETNRNGFIYHIGCSITLSDHNGPILVLVSTDFIHTGCLITLLDRNGPILDLVYPILTILLTQFQLILADLISESDKAVRAMHSCKCWFLKVNFLSSENLLRGISSLHPKLQISKMNFPVPVKNVLYRETSVKFYLV